MSRISEVSALDASYQVTRNNMALLNLKRGVLELGLIPGCNDNGPAIFAEGNCTSFSNACIFEVSLCKSMVYP